MTQTKKAPRRLERTFAFKVLYGLCFTPAGSEADVLRAFQRSPDRPENMEDEDSFAWGICFGVWKNMADIDRAIEGFSQNWRVERMGKVEITLLRIALYELMHLKEVPPKVAINEAVELSKQFGDERSRSFVNGILDAAARRFGDDQTLGAEEKA